MDATQTSPPPAKRQKVLPRRHLRVQGEMDADFRKKPLSYLHPLDHAIAGDYSKYNVACKKARAAGVGQTPPASSATNFPVASSATSRKTLPSGIDYVANLPE